MDEAIAATNFARWDKALQTGDAAKVAALYAENVTLLPTLAQRIVTDLKGAEEYFVFFGTFHPRVTMLEEYVIDVSEDSYLHTGVYRFTLGPADKRETVDARFSLLWKKVENGEWKILHHHSSRIPVV